MDIPPTLNAENPMVKDGTNLAVQEPFKQNPPNHAKPEKVVQMLLHRLDLNDKVRNTSYTYE